MIPGLATALPWNVGDDVSIVLTIGVPSGFGSSGGLFTVTNLDTGAQIQTFCVELDEFIGSKVADVSDDIAIGGGRNTDSGDPLSDETKWLYWRFTEGYSFNVKALQLAIWLLEGEYYDVGDWKTWYVSQGGDGSLAEAAVSYVALAQGQHTTADIKVLDIAYASGNPGQSYLIRIPEPMTISLLGLGLLGVGIAARRMRKRA